MDSLHRVDSVSELSTGLGIFNLIRGVLNGTNIISTSNLTVCEGNLTRLVNEAINGWNFAIALDPYNSAYAWVDMISHANDITTSCWYGFFESYSRILSYAIIFSDPSFFGTNILMKVGNMYTNVINVYWWFIGDSKTTFTSAFDAGFAFGEIAFHLMVQQQGL